MFVVILFFYINFVIYILSMVLPFSISKISVILSFCRYYNRSKLVVVGPIHYSLLLLVLIFYFIGTSYIFFFWFIMILMFFCICSGSYICCRLFMFQSCMWCWLYFYNSSSYLIFRSTLESMIILYNRWLTQSSSYSCYR